MKQLMFLEPNRLEWQEVAEPSLSDPKGALVKPIAVAACDLDIAVVKGYAPIPGPFPLGHEFVAEVLEVGEEVTSFKAGDIAVVTFQIACGECPRCAKGLTGNCTSVKQGSMYGLGSVGGEWGGAWTDVVAVPFAEAMLLPLPAGIEPKTLATASDNICDGYRTVGPHLLQSPGATVLIVSGGASSIPLFAVDIARSLGAGSIDFIDRRPHVLELAERFGANAIEGPPPAKAGRYAITVDASGDPAGLSCALRSTEPGGICTSIGIYYQDVPIPMLEMYSKGITFTTGRPHSRADLPHVLSLIGEGKIDPDSIATFVPWESTAEALLEAPIKLVSTR